MYLSIKRTLNLGVDQLSNPIFGTHLIIGVSVLLFFIW